MAQRGSYAKGIAKREEILDRALDVIARTGIRGASVKEIADAAGLSQPGLLHYFDSKEELFTAILRKRDQRDGVTFFGRAEPATLSELKSAFLDVVRHNASVPGQVELFSRLAVDAADGAHPAHAYFRERGQAMRAQIVAAVIDAQADGVMPTTATPETLARLLQATADGLQVQWLADRSVDMVAPIDALFSLLTLPATDAA